MGPKVGQKWVLGCKSGSRFKTHFSTHLKPISAYSRNPLFTQFKGGGNSFPKKPLRQSRTPKVLGRVPARNGVLGEVFAPCVSSRNKDDEHFPEHPVSGRHLSEHSPEHFWGVGGFALLEGATTFANLDLSVIFCSFLGSADCKRGRVKKRHKSSESVKNIFDTFRHFSRRAKNVKNRQKVSKIFSTLFDNFRAAPFFRPLLGGSDWVHTKGVMQPHAILRRVLRRFFKGGASQKGS